MNEKPYVWPKLADKNASTMPSPTRFEPCFQSDKSTHENAFSSLMQPQANDSTEKQRNEPELEPLRLIRERVLTLESTVSDYEQQLALQKLTINLFNEVTSAQNAHVSHMSKQILLQILKTNSPNETLSFAPAVWLHALECLKEKLGADEFRILTHDRNVSNIELQAQKLFSNQKYTIIADETLPIDEIHVEYQESRTAASITDISEHLVKIIEGSE